MDDKSFIWWIKSANALMNTYRTLNRDAVLKAMHVAPHEWDIWALEFALPSEAKRKDVRARFDKIFGAKTLPKKYLRR